MVSRNLDVSWKYIKEITSCNQMFTEKYQNIVIILHWEIFHTF